MEKQRKVLFIHNTLPEYRIQFFSELAKFVDLTLVITDQKLATTIYQLSSKIPDTLKVVNVDNVSSIKLIGILLFFLLLIHHIKQGVRILH